MWRLKKILLNNKQVNMKSMKKSRDLETHENENTMTQSIWDITKAVQYIYIYIPCIYMKAYLNKLKQSKLTPKGTSKRKKPKVST